MNVDWSVANGLVDGAEPVWEMGAGPVHLTGSGPAGLQSEPERPGPSLAPRRDIQKDILAACTGIKIVVDGLDE